MTAVPRLPDQFAPHRIDVAAMMPSRRKLTTGLGIFLFSAGLAVPLAAEQGSWEELNGKVNSLYREGKYAEALSVAQEALRVAEASFGGEHPAVARSLENYGALLWKTNREAEAGKLEDGARVIRAKHGP